MRNRHMCIRSEQPIFEDSILSYYGLNSLSQNQNVIYIGVEKAKERFNFVRARTELESFMLSNEDDYGLLKKNGTTKLFYIESPEAESTDILLNIIPFIEKNTVIIIYVRLSSKNAELYEEIFSREVLKNNIQIIVVDTDNTKSYCTIKSTEVDVCTIRSVNS